LFAPTSSNEPREPRLHLRVVERPGSPPFLQIPHGRRQLMPGRRAAPLPLKIGRGKAFGEPAVDRYQQIAGFGAAAPAAAQAGEADGGAQFPEPRLLLLGDAQRFAIQFLGGFGIPLR
jgi:hypothetical protein